MTGLDRLPWRRLRMAVLLCAALVAPVAHAVAPFALMSRMPPAERSRRNARPKGASSVSKGSPASRETTSALPRSRVISARPSGPTSIRRPSPGKRARTLRRPENPTASRVLSPESPRPANQTSRPSGDHARPGIPVFLSTRNAGGPGGITTPSRPLRTSGSGFSWNATRRPSGDTRTPWSHPGVS